MPIYEYKCAACGHVLETLQKISDDPLTTCPACGADALNKLISAAGFRLKGGGWYETDFKTGGKKNVAQSETTTKSGSPASGSSQSKGTAASKKSTGSS
jgi:putative FmdB family regulatory protein